MAEAIEQGRIPAPAGKRIPTIRPGSGAIVETPLAGISMPEPCFGPEHIHAFEDSAQVIVNCPGIAELLDLMVDAANEVMALYGDEFDFVGFMANSDPNFALGPFYLGMENDVQGIGDPSGMGTPLFDMRAALGLGGTRIEGLFLIADVNVLEPGTAPAADLTRLITNHELEHRFAMYLPDLLDGRRLQGDFMGCGRPSHWNWKVDAQGSCMEISEWTGAAPAQFASLRGFRNESFNTDIGGVFSYPDLYLMGYVSPAELDASVSQLRYMDGAGCTATPYAGSISSFTAAHLVAAAGPRIPSMATSQKHFRTAWVMLHQPGDPPDSAERERAVTVLRQQRIDWFQGTLGRGTMSHRLFDCPKAERAPTPPGSGGTRSL